MQDVKNTISQMANPFDVEQDELISLASGEVLEKTAADRLLSSEELGEDQFSKFTERNLLCDAPDIFTNLERNKLQTFSTNKKKVIKSYKGKEISAKSNRNFFARLLVIAKNRKVDLKQVLSYSLGCFPLSLAAPTGGLVKTAKSKLLEIVEDEAGSIDINNFHNNAIIVDAMAVLQVIKGKVLGQ